MIGFLSACFSFLSFTFAASLRSNSRRCSQKLITGGNFWSFDPVLVIFVIVDRITYPSLAFGFEALALGFRESELVLSRNKDTFGFSCGQLGFQLKVELI